ncbi:probable vacuolar atp synthase subunit g (vma-10) [Serendipita indica DSM 11827]|uniref:V-type proton ATPase subunit G n=1 Tax=Serendipita indica (strain DSM 11827) TaxID=1109443 RepID=G4TMX9_SERID|nr:probable vacuolar atp synthase subunit g (vma-10) [Serendipita indica DSM 11827]
MVSQAARSQGIQTLLEAEKDAAKVVQEARQYRTQKLKDARSEAAKELEAYKQKKDAEHAGVTQANQKAIDEETDQKLKALEASYNENKDKVVKKLLDRVLLVKPELHPNLKKV